MRNYQIYLAGGMKNVNFEVSNAWRKKIIEHFQSDYRLRYTVSFINPNNYFNFLQKSHKTEREIREFDLLKVRESELIIVNFNDPNSIGTAQELAVAYEYRIPVIGLNVENEELHPWLIECCNRIFTNFDEMLQYVKDFYLT